MNRRRTPKRILATHSARSVKQQKRNLVKKKTSRSQKPALARLRARVGQVLDHWAERTSEKAAGPATRLIGLDVANPPSRLQTGSWAPVIAAIVLGSLFLAVLRMDVIRLRFGLAGMFEEQLRLEELKRELTVDMRQLRDPAALARHARELGFQRAQQLIDLAPDHDPHAPAARQEPVEGIALAVASSRGPAGPRP